MKRTEFAFLIFLVFIFLGGCAGETYEFQGNSENWEMTYRIHSTDTVEEADISLVYLGEGETPTTIDYFIKNPNVELRGHVLYEVDGIDWKETICFDCYPLRKNEEIIVEVSWEDKMEDFTLTHGN